VAEAIAMIGASIGLVFAVSLMGAPALYRWVGMEGIFALTGVLAIAAIVATWPAWSGYALVFNAVYFAIAAGLVTRGYLRGDERYINLGLAIVALGLLTRYVDVFWSLLARSAFFIIGGLLLLAVAFALERMRRGLIRGMAAPEPRDDTSSPTEVPA